MSINHKGTQTIETMRLILRRFQLKDAKDMFDNWASDPLVCRYLSWGPHRELEDSRKRIVNWINNYGNENFYLWAIELKSDHTLIGSISLEISNEIDQSCEVGYCIGKSYWNRGIMTEALRAVMHYLFFEVGYIRIQAKHDVLNTASGKVMQKAGMHFAKTEYHVGTRRDGSRYDCDVYEKNITDEG
jgi:ribosomal-protein-alanine N-acetyltransferase